MTTRIICVLALAGLALVSVGAMAEREATGSSPHRVVIHVNSGDASVQRGVLNNIRHLYQELGREQLTVELVAHGAGLALLTKRATTFGNDLAQLQREYGVRYTACSNTMKAMQLTRDDLIEQVGDTVPAMVRLMERQEQGWAYIKP